MKPGHIFIELYNVQFYFFINWPREEYIKYCEEHFDLDDPPSPHDQAETAELDDHDPKTYLIWVKPHADYLAHLSHETDHGSSMVMKWIGHKPDYDNDEPKAYLSGYLFKKALESASL